MALFSCKSSEVCALNITHILQMDVGKCHLYICFMKLLNKFY